MRLLCLGLLTMVLQVPGVLAKDLTRSFSLTYDKSSIPSIYMMLDWESSGVPYNGANLIPGNVNGMVCGSATDSTYGACSTRLSNIFNSDSYVWSYPYGFGEDIKLKLTSVQEGITRDVVIKGVAGNGCNMRPMSYYHGCGSNDQMNLRLYMMGEQLNLLSAGAWKGTLILYQHNSDKSTANLGTWSLNLTLQVNDSGNQRIYFPAFPGTAPQVDLNLTNRPGTRDNASASGSTSLDMCLYDGSNSASRRISLLFQDEGASASSRPTGQFSVYREGADKSHPANRLDYQVHVMNPTTGALQNVSNGSEIIWADTNRRSIQRQVVLPSVPGVVLCVPAPITLTTPDFRLADKTAGRYSGMLRIIYTPTTQTHSP